MSSALESEQRTLQVEIDGNAHIEDDYLNVFRNMIVSVSHRGHSMSWKIEIGYVLKYMRTNPYVSKLYN